MATKTTTPALSAEQIQELLALSTEADSVELKLTVPESDQRSTVAALGLDPLDAQIRQVFFFDTPDLALDRQGVVVRARRDPGQGRRLRREAAAGRAGASCPSELRQSPSFGVEVDALPGGFVCSASMKARARADRRPRMRSPASARCASSSPRSSGRSSPRTRRRASSSTT